MLHMLKNSDKAEENETGKQWLKEYSDDFKKRFLQLLSYEFRDMDVHLSLGVVDPAFLADESESNIGANLIASEENTE